MHFNLNDRNNKIFILLLSGWVVLNLVQAALTPLSNDEAYYWVYSRYPAWGYFDHPPMIAVMIGIGYMLLKAELGVRLLVVLSQAVALVIMWSMTDERKRSEEGSPMLFFMLVALIPVFNMFGFIATPDSPLLLFSVLFLLSYKLYLREATARNILMLAFSMAALMYSKYHGALIILSVLISNPRLLKAAKFYIAPALAIILFLPHLWWQYSNDFPSFRYHLVERVSGFELTHVPEYLLNLLAIQNPFILPVCIVLMARHKAADQFEKSLKFITGGVIIFFFISSFRYRVQPQWTSLISIPVVLYLFDRTGLKTRFSAYIKWLAVVMFPLILFARASLMFDFLPVKYLKEEFHNNRKRAEEISNLAGERPVVFTNSYQDPSEYMFYTGKFAHSLDNLNYRKTQYDLWNFEERVNGKEVLYVPHFLNDYIRAHFDRKGFPGGDTLYYRIFNDFRSLQKECVILPDIAYEFSKSRADSLRIDIFNPYPYAIELNNKEFPVVFQVDFLKNGLREEKFNLELPPDIISINPGDTISASCRFYPANLTGGEYRIAICSETGILYDTRNSKFRRARVTD